MSRPVWVEAILQNSAAMSSFRDYVLRLTEITENDMEKYVLAGDLPKASASVGYKRAYAELLQYINAYELERRAQLERTN